MRLVKGRGVIRPSVSRLVSAVALLALALTAAAGMPPAAAAADNDACYECHNAGTTQTIQVDGQTKSLAVDRARYEASKHGQLDCTGCHFGFEPGNHTTKPIEGWLQTAKLDACRNCHADVFSMYEQSFHGSLTSSGDKDAPLCADCHEAHNIVPPESLEFRTSILDLCARCHADRSETYLDGYHGKAFLLGNEETAVCTDCHGGHKILPASDPHSMVSDQSKLSTCQQCHPEANQNFAGFNIHVNPRDPRDGVWTFIFWLAYILLIVSVFSFAAIHTTLYIYRGFKDGLYSRRHGH